VGQAQPRAPSSPGRRTAPARTSLTSEESSARPPRRAARTDTLLGERYRRLARRIGKLKALVAVARSILVIIWHLLSDPAAQFCELGSAYHASRTGTQRKARGHIRQLEALGYTVTLTQAA
jgi:transposase